MPPILRETCAFLAENWICRQKVWPHQKRLEQRRIEKQQRSFARDRNILLAALRTPDAPYDYRWNYPIAQVLAEHRASALTSERLSALFAGKLDLKQIMTALNR